MLSLKLYVKKVLGRLYLRYFTLGKLLDNSIEEIIKKYKDVLNKSRGEEIVKALFKHLDGTNEDFVFVDDIKSSKELIENIIKNMTNITANLQDVTEICIKFIAELPVKIAELQSKIIKALTDAILEILSKLAQLLVDILMPVSDPKLPSAAPLKPIKALVEAAANGKSPFNALQNLK